MSVTVMAGQRTTHNRARRRMSRAGLHLFLIVLAIIFAWPLVYAVYMSLRPYGEIVASPTGPFSLPATLNLDNYFSVWNSQNILGYFWNTAVITIPAVLLTLWISSMVAFAIAKYSWRFNLMVLMIFTAGNLLPPQVIIVPLYRLYLLLPVPAPLSDNGLMYDQFLGLILIHTTFQTGFCTFVLSNYMKTLSKELVEAAMIDGAGVFTIYRRVILPLCRPALAALATLLFVWIYNDFFWALMLFKSGDKRPITAALNNLSGAFFTDPTQLAALSVIAAVPTIVLYMILQRNFVRGLTLGSTKG
ncbi:MAG TPA: carbohydrate ABC transporter permease [Candidatus Limnocylindrales bacterium]